MTEVSMRNIFNSEIWLRWMEAENSTIIIWVFPEVDLNKGFEGKWFIWEVLPDNTGDGNKEVKWSKEGSH